MDTAEYVRLPLSAIRPPSDPHRLSYDIDALQELADDMAVNGLHQPIGVRGPFDDGTHEIVWGDRRHRAAQMNHWDAIDCKRFPASYDPLLARAAENFHREDLSPVEEAQIVRRFRERNQPTAQIMRELRRSRAWVEQRIALLDYPEDVQRAVHSGALSLAVAHSLAAIDHEPYRLELIDEAARCGATSQTAAIWLAHYARDKAQIITNQKTIDEIRTARDDFRIVVTCQGCERETEIGSTRLLRFCAVCCDAIDKSVHAATA